MREKIYSKDIPNGKLEIGKKYGVDLIGSSMWLEFLFTGKRMQSIKLMSSNGVEEETKMSRRVLKQMIRDKSVVRFLFEAE